MMENVQIVGDRVVFGMQLPIQSQSRLFVSDWELTATVADLAAIATAADRSGWHYLGVCDHTAIPERLVSAMGAEWYDTVATLGWLAGQTTNVHLLSHVLILNQRHPLRAAKELATLDHLSGGRLIIGVGAGHVNEEFDQLNGPDGYADRGPATDEAIVALAALLTDEAPTHVGERWQFSGMHVSPRPVRTPRPPIWVGGSTPPALRRAARLGDGWLPQGTRRADLPGQIAQLRAYRDEFRDGAPIDIGTIAEPCHVDLGGGRDGLPSYTMVGSAEQIAASYRELIDMGVNHLQIALRARSAAEFVEQTLAFGETVGPLLTN